MSLRCDTVEIARSFGEIYHEWARRVDRERLLEVTRRLWEVERGQTFACYHASARLAEALLQEVGCERVERIPLPADGKTVFQDKTQPLGWRATVGRLEVVRAALPFHPRVIADFEAHPFHLIKGSVATPPGGLETRLVSQEAIEAGADARGALVLLHPEQRPSYRLLEGTGALGLVSDYLVGRHDTPWAIQWVNGCSDSYSWHIGANDRPSIGFSVSPQTGDRLREALRQGEVHVRVTCDGERYVDTVDVVTGVIPGQDPREIWLLAHLYEPLANDNASGVACALELARTLRALHAEGELSPPRFTLRLVFGMEVYGFAAYAEKRGGRLGDDVLCALNLDALPILPGDRALTLGLSQSGSPSSVDYRVETLFRSGLARRHTVAAVQTEGLYADDRQLGDSTLGVPTLWFTRAQPVMESAPRGTQPLYLWHNSEQEMGCIEPKLFEDITALYGTLVADLLGGDPEMSGERLRQAFEISRQRLETEQHRLAGKVGVLPAKWLRYRLEIESRRLRDLIRFGEDPVEVEERVAELAAVEARLAAKLPAPSSVAAADPVWDLAESIVIRRLRRGLPRDMAAAPVEQRNVQLSYPATLALVHADGRRTVAELLDRAGWETGAMLEASEVRRIIGSLQYLARHGYIELGSSCVVTRPMVVSALRKAGIGEGDLLFVHSALSPFGVVEGGAETLVEALLEAVGERGTILMPAFTASILCFRNGPARNRNLVPFHPRQARSKTGIVGETFRRRPGVLRSAHPSHSVAGVGPLAAACLDTHRRDDAPTGPSSPLARLPEFGGKIVFLGASLSACTFLHYLENVAGVDYLEPSLCVVEDDAGRRTLLPVPQNCPGNRDFYRPDPQNARIFRHLAASGVGIASIPLGFSRVQVIEAAPFAEAGLEALRADPGILLPQPAATSSPGLF